MTAFITSEWIPALKVSVCPDKDPVYCVSASSSNPLKAFLNVLDPKCHEDLSVFHDDINRQKYCSHVVSCFTVICQDDDVETADQSSLLDAVHQLTNDLIYIHERLDQLQREEKFKKITFKQQHF